MLIAGAIGVGISTVARAGGMPAVILQALPVSISDMFRDADRGWLLASALCVAGAAVLARWGRATRVVSRGRRWVPVAGAVLGLGVAVLLAAWQNPLYDDSASSIRAWRGFSPAGLTFGLLLACALLAGALAFRRRDRLLATISTTVIGVLAVLPLIQTPATFDSTFNNEFTLDEILAPASGRMPGFDYVNQYESLLGYPLALVTRLFPAQYAQNPEAFAVGWLIVLQVCTLALATATAIRLAPRGIRWVMPLVVIPFAYLVDVVGLQYYGATPMRTFLPVLLLAVIAFIALARRGRRPTWWATLVPGVVAGMAAFNNLDFGVPAAVAAAVAIATFPQQWRARGRALIWFAVGAFAFVAAMLLAGAATGRQYHPGYSLFFVRNFGVSGIMSVDGPVFGLHTGFVLLGVVGAAVAGLGLRRSIGRARVLYQAILFQSVFLVLALAYYSGRSVTPTLVTGSCLLAAVLFALLVAAGYPVLLQLRRRGWRRLALVDWIAVAAIVLTLGTSVASWARFPSPVDAVAHLSRSTEPYRTGHDPSPALDALPPGTDLIGILAISGSVWSARLGVPNANLFLHSDYIQWYGAADLECLYIEGLPGSTLVTTRTLYGNLSTSLECAHALRLESVRSLVTVDDGTPVEWVSIERR